ncbi:hypothetical protein MTP04_01650 [Lysinibacillus sp. PLM2]|nr:hypothetical protein MTP04_01650 [Lysinibacillus sp. PLM2]
MENAQRVREDIWESVKGLSDEQLNMEVAEGTWTIAQVLEHLYLIEKVAIEGFTNIKRIDERNPVKIRRVHLIIDRSQKVDAPEFLVPKREFQTLVALKEKLQGTREIIVRKYKTYSERDLTEMAMPHPVFGSLTLGQWISFIGYHEKRHLAQIEEIKEALIN